MMNLSEIKSLSGICNESIKILTSGGLKISTKDISFLANLAEEENLFQKLSAFFKIINKYFSKTQQSTSVTENSIRELYFNSQQKLSQERKYSNTLLQNLEAATENMQLMQKQIDKLKKQLEKQKSKENPAFKEKLKKQKDLNTKLIQQVEVTKEERERFISCVQKLETENKELKIKNKKIKQEKEQNSVETEERTVYIKKIETENKELKSKVKKLKEENKKENEKMEKRLNQIQKLKIEAESNSSEEEYKKIIAELEERTEGLERERKELQFLINSNEYEVKLMKSKISAVQEQSKKTADENRVIKEEKESLQNEILNLQSNITDLQLKMNEKNRANKVTVISSNESERLNEIINSQKEIINRQSETITQLSTKKKEYEDLNKTLEEETRNVKSSESYFNDENKKILREKERIEKKLREEVERGNSLANELARMLQKEKEKNENYEKEQARINSKTSSYNLEKKRFDAIISNMREENDKLYAENRKLNNIIFQYGVSKKQGKITPIKVELTGDRKECIRLETELLRAKEELNSAKETKAQLDVEAPCISRFCFLLADALNSSYNPNYAKEELKRLLDIVRQNTIKISETCRVPLNPFKEV